MRLVKFYGPNVPGLDHPLWVNREHVSIVQEATAEYPGCAFIYLVDNSDPFVVQGTVDAIVWDLRNAP